MNDTRTTTTKKIATVISIIGHPLLTLSIFSIIVFFAYEEFHKALFHSLLIIGVLFVPVTIKMYRNSRNGTYTNFDVSDQSQRQSWYIFIILLMLLLTIILFATDQPRTLRYSILLSLILLSVSKMLNYYVKSSLHVSFNIFLSFLIIHINPATGIIFLAFTALISWSRLILNRHTLKEIIAGFVIGFLIGISSLYLIQ